MKYSNIFLGIITIGLSIAFIQDDLINLKVKNNGKIVNMKIIEIPGSCLGTKAKWFMKVKFEDKIILKQIPGQFCENHQIGEIIQVCYLEGEDRILLPEEGVTLGFIASGFFILVGLYVVYYGVTYGKEKTRKRLEQRYVK